MENKFVRFAFLFFCIILLLNFPVFAQSGNAGDLKAQAALVSEFEINGLKILFKRRANSSTISVNLFLRGGTRNLTAETAGIESFMLTAATEASKKYPREMMRRELAKSGTVIGAGASFDYSALSMGTPRAEFERAFNIFTDVALNPTFKTNDVERLRTQIISGLRESDTDPDASLANLSQKSIFVGHVYANEPNGTIETVSKFKPEDLRRYHQNAMQTSKLLLVIVGDLDAEMLKTKIAAAFGKLPRGNYQEKPVAPLVFDKPSVNITARDLPTNYVQGSYAAPALSNEDIYAMQVATAILQERVFYEVRVLRNLSYAPSANLDTRAANTGGIYVSAVDANQSVSIMLDEIKRLQTDSLNEQIVEGATGQFLTTYYLGQETNAAQAADLARYELTGGGWRNAFLFLDKIRAVKSADVRRVAQKYMKNLKFVFLGNPNYVNRETFTKQ